MDHGALAEPTARIDPVTTSEIEVKILGKSSVANPVPPNRQLSPNISEFGNSADSW